MRILFALVLLLASPVSACERPFRTGMAAFRAAETSLEQVEGQLYRGLGWATRSRVLARLEGLSARTSACDEVARLVDQLDAAQQQIARARAQFSVARSLCLGENQRRAESNLDALDDTDGAIRIQRDYLQDLAGRC